MDALFTFFGSLIAWQNMLFTATVGLGAVLFGVQAFGIFGDNDHDHDVDHDHDLDAGHDHDHDLDAGHDLAHADHDHDLDHDHHGTSSALDSALKMLGVGRLPLSLLLPLALTSFGFSGLFASLFFGGIGSGSATFTEALIFPILGLAFAGSFGAVQVVSRLFRKIVPDAAKSSSDRYDLLGLVGVVKSGKLDQEFGNVLVKDNFGHPLEVPCMALDVARGAKYGDEVVLVDWDPAKNRFKVVPFNEAETDESKRLQEGRRRAKELRAANR